MSIDGNSGRCGHTNLIFCMILPVGLVLCMLGKHRISPPLAARNVEACLLLGIARILHEFLLIYAARLGVAHQDSGAVCLYW